LSDYPDTVRKVVIIVVLLAVLVAIGLGTAYREPSYAGRPLSYWIGHLECTLVSTNGDSFPAWRKTGGRAEADEAKKALRAIGAPCLPVLLRRLATKQESAVKDRLILLGFKSNMISRPWLVEQTSDWIRGRALTGILALGQAARPAVGKLLILANSNDPYVRASAQYALKKLAPSELDKINALNQQPVAD